MKFSRLYVNLDNIKYNLKEIIKEQKYETGIIAMVKANAYGLGILDVSKYLEKENLAKFLGVAYFEEAKYLKQNNIKLPIIVLESGLIEEIPEVIKHEDIIPSVSDYEYIVKLNNECAKYNIKKKVHVEVNTGMNRCGFDYKEAVSFIKKINDLNNIIIDGIYMHFSSIPSDFKFTEIQKQRFDNVLDELQKININIPNIHICNSAGSLYISNKRYNLIRPGIMMYGYYPDNLLKIKINLKPVCSLVSKITRIDKVAKDTPISYDQKYITNKVTKIATVNLGYGDGYRRALSNTGKVSIKDKICDVIGNICMDAFMVDITELEDIDVGDDVVIFDDKNIFLDDVANTCDTINYEILSNISARVERIYIKK